MHDESLPRLPTVPKSRRRGVVPNYGVRCLLGIRRLADCHRSTDCPVVTQAPDTESAFFARRRLAFIFSAFLLFLTQPSLADEIYFQSGYSRTGVVLRETADSITFQTEMGITTVRREKVDFVEKAQPEENRLLRKKWREKEIRLEEAREAKRRAEREFEEAQVAKGLIKFEGTWIKPEEKEEILELRRRAREHRLQFEREQREKGMVKFQHLWVTPEQAQKLREMEPKIYGLYDEIRAERRLVESLRGAMANVQSFEEANKFSDRIKELQASIEEKEERLGELLNKVDEVEAASEKYEVPEEFRRALTQPENFPEEP